MYIVLLYSLTQPQAHHRRPYWDSHHDFRIHQYDLLVCAYFKSNRNFQTNSLYDCIIIYNGGFCHTQSYRLGTLSIRSTPLI